MRLSCRHKDVRSTNARVYPDDGESSLGIFGSATWMTCMQCLMIMYLSSNSKETDSIRWTLLGCVDMMVVAVSELISSSPELSSSHARS
jgi:hypothetical protein